MTTMTTTTTRLIGHAAIAYAEQHDLALCKFTDPSEEARDGLSVDEAREIAAEDPSLIYLDAEDGYRIERLDGSTDGLGDDVLFATEDEAWANAETAFGRDPASDGPDGVRAWLRVVRA